MDKGLEGLALELYNKAYCDGIEHSIYAYKKHPEIAEEVLNELINKLKGDKNE